MSSEVVEEYRSSLSDLTFNSKPLISMLTMLAEDNEQNAADIVQVIEAHIQKAKSSEKLPALYLIDSIIKNMPKSSYLVMFLNNLVNIFAGVFEKVDEKTRGSMYKLRQTWNEIMPNKKLYALDIRVQKIDPAWPITAKAEETPVASIHVNPKFLMKQQQDERDKEQEDQEALMRQQLLAKQQELLKLQQERLELELAEAKARLDSQTKQFETQTPESVVQLVPTSKQKLPPVPSVQPSVQPSIQPSIQPPAQAAGSPIHVPTIAVQGIVRDPRVARDPRLARSADSSPKESTPPPTLRPDSLTIAPPAASTSSLPSRSSSSIPDEKFRGKDEKDLKSSSRSKSSSAPSSSSSRKSTTPPRIKDDKKEDSKKRSSTESRSKNGRSERGSDRPSSSQSSRSGHRSYKRHGSRSRSSSPDRDRKGPSPGTRSRSRSPRRSPRATEKRDRGHTWDQKEGGSEGKRRKSPERPVPVERSDDLVLDGVPEEVSDDGAPPAKKIRPEPAEGEAASLPPDFRELFGSQDQDYRRPPTTSSSFPQTPTTPDTPSTGRWAQFKATRPEEFPFAQPRSMLDLPSPGGRPQDVDMRALTMRRTSTSSSSSSTPISPEQLNIDIPAPLMLEQLDTVLSEADTQLRSGRLSHEQHQSILRQLGELQKLQKVKQELRLGRDGPDFGLTSPVGGTVDERLSPRSARIPPKDTDVRPPPGLPAKSPPFTFEGPPDSKLERGPGGHRGPGEAGMDPRATSSRGGRPKPMDPRQAARGALPPPPIPPASLTGQAPRPTFTHGGGRGRNLPPVPRPPLPPILAGPGRGGRPRFDKFGPAPVPGKFRLPYDTDKYYIPEHDPRWIAPMNDGARHKLYIDDKAYELPLGCPPRFIRLGPSRVEISVDSHSKGVKLDGICYYRIGDPTKEVTMNGDLHKISYCGPEKKIWIDDQAYEVHTDGPPQPITISGVRHLIQIDSIMNQVLVDDRVVCPFGGPKKQIEIGYQKHEVQFEPPPRKILIDGTLCEMNFKGKYPCVNMKGVDYGIRFDGPPRQIVINDKPWTVPMDAPRRARCATERQHILAFGGPGHEVIINGQWYEVKFNGPEKAITLGSKTVQIKLRGPPPEVKILGQVITDPAKIEELVGDAYIDPSLAILSSRHIFNEPDGMNDMPYSHSQRYDRKGPDMPPRPPMRGGRPPRGHDGGQRGYHRGQPPRGLPPHMDDRGRGSPRYDEGRNSPNMDHHRNSPKDPGDVPSLLHMEIEPPQPAPRPDGPPRIDPPVRNDGPPHRNDGPPHRNDGPPHRNDGPPRRNDGPPHRNDGPPHRNDGPPHRNDGPPHRKDGPPHRNDGPPHRNDVPPHRNDGPPHRNDGPPLRNDGPPHRIDGPPHRNDGPPLRHDGPPRFDGPGWYDDRFDHQRPMGDLPMRDGPPHDLPRRDGPMRDRQIRHDGHGPPGSRMPYAPPHHRGFRQMGPRFRGQRPQMHPPRMGYPDDGYYPPPHPHAPQAPPHDIRRPDMPPMYNQFMPPAQGNQNQGDMDLPAMLPSQIDVNSLFSKLVQSGIIKKADDLPTNAASPGAPAIAGPEQNKTDSTAPKPKEKPADKKNEEVGKEKEPPMPVIPKVQEKLEDIPDMTSFNVDNMKKKYPGVVQRMYGGIQCSSCGVRFLTDDMDRYREHLDWHFRQNKRDKDGIKMAKFRPWYYATNEWIQFEEISDLEERSHSAYFERLLQSHSAPGNVGAQQAIETPISCPAATGEAGDDICEMCGEQFENFFDEDTEEWRLRDAVRYGGKTYHPACYEDVQDTSLTETPTPDAEEAPPVDPLADPLAFLSKLTAKTVKQENPESSETTPMDEAGDVKPELKSPSEIKTETAPPVVSGTSESPATVIVKEEPSS